MSEEITIEDFWSVFTPAPKHIVERYGPGAALVWGCILRYSKIQDGPGYCYASYATIAEEIGLCSRTVRTHIASLIEDGYLEEIDPAETGKQLHRTRKLKTTSKLQIGIKAIEEIEDGNICHPSVEEDGKSVHPRMANSATGVAKLTTDHNRLTNYLTDDEEDRDENLQLEESSSSLSSSLKKITGVNSNNQGFIAALAALKEAGVDSDRLQLWLKDETGWPEARPPNATRKKPWPSQVADLVPVWKSPHERTRDWMDEY